MKTLIAFVKRATCVGLEFVGAAGASTADYPQVAIASGMAYASVTSAPAGHFADTFSFSVNASAFAGGVQLVDPDANALCSDDYKTGSGRFALGDYYFATCGDAVGALGGKYQLGVTAIAAPVTESEFNPKFLAGSGVMGAIALRRNRSKTP
jgi:hypothetical protein